MNDYLSASASPFGGLEGPSLSISDKLDILIEQLHINIEHIKRTRGGNDRECEYRGILHTRRHLAATPLFKGIPNFRQTRIAMLRAERVDELLSILEEVRGLLLENHSASAVSLDH